VRFTDQQLDTIEHPLRLAQGERFTIARNIQTLREIIRRIEHGLSDYGQFTGSKVDRTEDESQISTVAIKGITLSRESISNAATVSNHTRPRRVAQTRREQNCIQTLPIATTACRPTNADISRGSERAHRRREEHRHTRF